MGCLIKVCPAFLSNRTPNGTVTWLVLDQCSPSKIKTFFTTTLLHLEAATCLEGWLSLVLQCVGLNSYMVKLMNFFLYIKAQE